MELSEAFARRRSCRSYHPDPIDDDLLARVLAAARRGPSAGNTWGLDLLVLRGPEETGAYWDTTLPAERRRSFPWPGLLRAPVLVIPTVRPGAYVERYAEADKARTGLGVGEDAWSVPYWWVDGGAAVMSLLLAATDAGLGSLLFGQFGHEPAVAERFGIPADRRAIGTVALGWPDGADRPSMSAQRRRPDLDDFVRWGSWSPDLD